MRKDRIKAKMRVIQINAVCSTGSTGRIVKSIHRQIVNKGHESYVAYGRGKDDNDINAIRIGSQIGVYLHALKTRVFDMHGFGSENETKRFLKRVENIKPDVIHLHNIHGYYINISALFAFIKYWNVPVVWTLHDCWSFTGHCAYFEYIGCSKWINGCYQCPQKKAYPTSYILDNSKRNYLEKKKIFGKVESMTLVTPSRWLAALVKKSLLAEYNIRIIPNGIDTTIFKPTASDFRKEYGLHNKYIILGIANGWDERKGLKYFIELKEYLRKDEKIVLVGLSSKQQRMLRKKALCFGKIHSEEDLAKIYSAADIFVNPTLEESFGLTNLEAQACGTYVATFDSGATEETVVREEYGEVLLEKSAMSIRKAICKNRNIAYKRNYVSCVPNDEDQASKVVKIYQDVVNVRMD